MLQISQASENLIVDEEVGSPATYTKRYQHPEWPGGASGITVAIGYDAGYQSSSGVHADWDGQIASGMVDVLASVAGLKGTNAQINLASVRNQITIPFDAAMKVFDNVDKPRWVERTSNALSNCDKLAPDCLGALTSLSYNRGASYNLTGDRYREMNAIKAHMGAQQFDKIPAEFRSMKRLWNNGLVGRREREALLFERGLSIMSGKHTEATAPKAPTRQQQVNRKAGKIGGTIGAGTGAGAGGSSKPNAVQGHEVFFVIAIAIVMAAAAAAITLWLNRHQQLPKADPIPVPTTTPTPTPKVV